MSLTWVVDPKERFVVLTITDPYTFEEWTAAVLSLLESTAFQQHRAILVDRRGVEAPTTAFTGAVLGFMASHSEALARRAAILVSDEVSFGMARMISLRAEFNAPATNLMVFYNYDKAVSWLTA
jgi:hypothetical protein